MADERTGLAARQSMSEPNLQGSVIDRKALKSAVVEALAEKSDIDSQKAEKKLASANGRSVATTVLLLNVANVGLGIQNNGRHDVTEIIMLFLSVATVCLSAVYILAQMQYDVLVELGKAETVHDVSMKGLRERSILVALLMTEVMIVLQATLSAPQSLDDAVAPAVAGALFLLANCAVKIVVGKFSIPNENDTETENGTENYTEASHVSTEPQSSWI